VPCACRNHLVTARAEVLLCGLVRLNPFDLKVDIIGELHVLTEQDPHERQSDDDECTRDNDYVEWRFLGLVLGIEAHHTSIAAGASQPRPSHLIMCCMPEDVVVVRSPTKR